MWIVSLLLLIALGLLGIASWLRQRKPDASGPLAQLEGIGGGDRCYTRGVDDPARCPRCLYRHELCLCPAIAAEGPIVTRTRVVI